MDIREIKTGMVGTALSICMLFMTSGLSSSTALDAHLTPSGTQIVMSDEEIRFVHLANIERMNARLPVLEVDPVLVEAARAHSKEMCEKNYFSHESPTSNLRTPMKRYLEKRGSRPDYAMVGENLFYCSRVDVNRGQAALMGSQYHRDNILNHRFEKVGVGIFVGRDGSFWVTQMFLTNNPG